MATNSATPQPQSLAKVDPRMQLISKVLEAKQHDIAAMLPQHLKADAFLNVAKRLISGDQKLLACDPLSLYMAIHKAAQFGLEPDGVLGHAYIIPYGTEATFQIGYRGLIALAARSGAVSYIKADVVKENDVFTFEEREDGIKFEHAPCLRGPRGAMYAVWAKAKLTDGNNVVIVLTDEDIQKIKATSKSAGKDGSPWQKHEEEMWKKSAIKRLCKNLPSANENYDLVRAAMVDDFEDQGITINGETGTVLEKTGPAAVPNLSTATNGDLKSRIAQAKDKQPTTIQGTEAAKTEAPKAEAQKPDAVVAPEIATQDGVEWIRGTVTRVFPPKAAGKGVKMSVAMGKDVILSTFHESHFPHLKDANGKVCVFQFERKGEYLNIEYVRAVGETEFDTDGTPIIQQREVVKDAAPATEDAALMSGSFFDEKK